MKPDNAFFEQCWPEEIPIPNETQWQNAERRYSEDNRQHNEKLLREGKVDISDYQFGLEFVVATYTPAVWKHLFNAEEV